MNTSEHSRSTTHHPERGRRYTIEELRELAERGNAWALCQVDQWELEFANEYTGTLSEKCTDPGCDAYGEPADLCCDESGALLEVDHGGWAHTVHWARAA